MEHKGTQTLETERLLLRRFEPEDAKMMFENWASDSEVTKYLTWKTHESVEDTAAILREWVSQYPDAKFYQWAIVPKELNEPIGSIGAVDVDDATEKVHIGYCIGRKWWHQGITSEAFRALIDFFFDEVGVNRIEARHDPNNPNSGKVMRKCGLRYEGTLRSADRNNQGICDVCYYGLLQSDRETTENGSASVSVRKVEKDTELAKMLLRFVEDFSWQEVKDHTVKAIRDWKFTDWETPFAAMAGDRVVGMATIAKTDYYPLPAVYPWISTIFVSEDFRGSRISEKLIDFANQYAKELGFDKTYIPTGLVGFYEKYGYRYVRDIVNYGNGVDRLYVKEIG